MQPGPSAGCPDPIVSFPRGKNKAMQVPLPRSLAKTHQYLETDALHLFLN